MVIQIRTKRKILGYIELHDSNIAQKVEIIIEFHFKNRSCRNWGGKQKPGHYAPVTGRQQSNGMIETYISSMGIRVFRALVAFSGKVSGHHEYTEAVMNGIKGRRFAGVLDSNAIQVLLGGDIL